MKQTPASLQYLDRETFNQQQQKNQNHLELKQLSKSFHRWRWTGLQVLKVRKLGGWV